MRVLYIRVWPRVLNLLVDECTLKQLGRTTDRKDHLRMPLHVSSASCLTSRRKLLLRLLSPWPGPLCLCLFEPSSYIHSGGYASSLKEHGSFAWYLLPGTGICFPLKNTRRTKNEELGKSNKTYLFHSFLFRISIIFSLIFPVLLVLLCSRTRYAVSSLFLLFIWICDLVFLLLFFLCLTAVCGHRISISLG